MTSLQVSRSFSKGFDVAEIVIQRRNKARLDEKNSFPIGETCPDPIAPNYNQFQAIIINFAEWSYSGKFIQYLSGF